MTPRPTLALGAVALPFLALSSCIVPEESDPTVDAGIDFATLFVHRGMTQVERPVLQPSASVGVDTIDGGGISGTVWANMELSNNNGNAWFPDGHAGRFTEIDLVGAYSRNIDLGEDLNPINLRVGIHNYNLPNGLEFASSPASTERGGTSEIFFQVSGEVLGATPYLNYRYDFDEVRGSYTIFGVTEDIPLADGWTLILDGSQAYSTSAQSSWNYGLDEAGWADLRGSAIVEWAYDDRTTISAGAHFSTIIDSAIDDWFTLTGIDDDVIWATLGVSWSL